MALSFLAEAFWFTFWATLIFFLGPAALSLAGFRMILFAILIWIAARLIYRWKFEKRSPEWSSRARRRTSSASAR